MHCFIDGNDVECDFENVSSHQRIISKFHNIDYERLITGSAKIAFSYTNKDGLHNLINNSVCYQSIDQLCQPWLQLLYDTDDSIAKDPNSEEWSGDHIHACMCLRYNRQLTPNTTEANRR